MTREAILNAYNSVEDAEFWAAMEAAQRLNGENCPKVVWSAEEALSVGLIKDTEEGSAIVSCFSADRKRTIHFRASDKDALKFRLREAKAHWDAAKEEWVK